MVSEQRDLFRQEGRKILVRVDGKSYFIEPKDIDQDEMAQAAKERYLTRGRRSRKEMFAEMMDATEGFPEAQDRFLDKFYNDLSQKDPTQEELAHWSEKTKEGSSWAVAYMLQKKYPDLTEEKAQEILDKVEKAEAKFRIDSRLVFQKLLKNVADPKEKEKLKFEQIVAVLTKDKPDEADKPIWEIYEQIYTEKENGWTVPGPGVANPSQT